MNEITLKEAYDLIQQSMAVIINDDDALAYPSLEGLTGTPNNEWMKIDWRSYDGQMRGISFIEDDKPITFDGHTLTMQDSGGAEVSLTLLVVINNMNLEPNILA